MPPVEGAAAPTSTITALPNVTQESVGCFGLCGHVRPGRPGVPRVGPLEWLRKVFGTVVRCFSPAAPGEARLPGGRQSSSGPPARPSVQDRLARDIGAVAAALTSPNASAEALAAALARAATTGGVRDARGAHELRQAALQQFVRSLEGDQYEQLTRLARAFGGTAAEGAQRLIEANPVAQQLLIDLQRMANGELIGHLPIAIDESLHIARANLQAGAPSARIGDALHFAFESAVPLVKLGVLSADDSSQADVDRLVLERLAQLPPEELTPLLAHARAEDLDRLRQATGLLRPAAPQIAPVPAAPSIEVTPDPAGIDVAPVAAAIEAEIATRVPRRAHEFRERAQQVSDRHGSAAALDCQAFHDDLIALGTQARELDAHCRLFARDNPLRDDKGMQWLRGHLAWLVKSAFGAHGGIDPHLLGTRELVRLTDALHALGFHELTHTLLGRAQQTCLADQRKLFRARFSAFVTSMVAAGPSPEGARQLLCGLAELEDAARALQDAQRAFDRDSAQRASSSTAPSSAATAPPEAVRAQSDLVRECLAEMPEQAAALELVLGTKGHQGLISALHVGAALASEAHERQLEERFAGMARLCEQLARETGAQQPATHRQIAAENLSPAMRRALCADHGLLVPAHGPPALQSGRLTAPQLRNMALEFERPLSEVESAMVSVGPYQVGAEFYQDAMRAFPLHLGDPAQTPAPDHERVPVSAQTLVRHLRPPSRSDAVGPRPPPVDPHDRVVQKDDVQATFARLIELCGNEELARTVTLYAGQRIMAPFLVACYQADPPILYLADGTPGRALQLPNVRDPLRSGATDHRQVSVYMGVNGRPQLEVDYRVEGRSLFTGMDGSQRYLSPDSHMQVHIRAEIDPQGRLLLLEAPSYRLDLRADDFQKPYRPPTVGDVVTAREGDELHSDLMPYSRRIGAEYQVLALRAIDAFERQPTPENAAAVVTACDLAPPEVQADLVPEALRVALQGEEAGALLSPTLFEALKRRLSDAVESQLLPGMIAVIRRGEF